MVSGDTVNLINSIYEVLRFQFGRTQRIAKLEKLGHGRSCTQRHSADGGGDERALVDISVGAKFPPDSKSPPDC